MQGGSPRAIGRTGEGETGKGMAQTTGSHPKTDPAPDIGPELAAYIPALRAYFSRQLRDRQLVDDHVQEVMLRMMAHRHEASIANIQGYLFRTASSVLKDQARRDRVRHVSDQTELTEDHHPVEECAADRVLLAREEISLVVKALGELPERTRDIFLMRRYEGLAYAEIAQRTGLSVSAVEKHVARAVAHLARRIAK